MQSYREQSSYHGNQRLLHPEAQECARLGDYGQHHQGQMLASYASRPGSEGCEQQLYPSFRRESGDYYYMRGKDLPGAQAQRRLAGPLPSGYVAQQAGAYSVQYLSEGQWRAPQAAMHGYSQFEQDLYTSQFSPSSGQQQLRHQPFQAPPGTPALAQPSPAPTAHIPQLAHQSSSALLAKYQHRAAQYNPQHFQPSASTSSSSSSSYPSPQGYSQPPGQAFDGYHMNASSQCDGYMVNASAAPSYGTQTSHSYQAPPTKTCYEQSKPTQGQHSLHPLQYSNAAKVALLNQQFAPYCSADIPAKSPMAFHQNFSPGSNPSPATPVAQSPSCCSTPSPLMVSSESLQCGPGPMGLGVRNRILQLMAQPSPTPTGLVPSPGSQAGAYEGFGMEGGGEKRASDLGLSSLTALSSQVANIPNTVQHLLISDTLALHRRQARRCPKRQGGPGEQLKSPQAESLDGGCSSSSEEQAERVRQLSGQSACSEQAYKARHPETLNATCSPAGPHGDSANRSNSSVPSKEELITQMCQEGKGGAIATLAEQGPRRGEKPIGVIVSREMMVNRGDVMGIAGQGDEHSRQGTFPISADKASGRNQQPNNTHNVMVRSTAQNGNGLMLSDPLAARMDSSKSPSCLAYGFRDMAKNDGGYHYMQYPTVPYSQQKADQFGLGERKPLPGKAEKSHSLLQEALQSNYLGRKYHSTYTPELQYSGFMDTSLQPGYPVRQMIELARKDVHGNTMGSPPGWGDGRTLSSAFGTEQSKGDLEPQLESGMSERKSVICDISPSRPFGRNSVPPTTSPSCGPSQDREFGRNMKGEKSCKGGQSVIQSGVFVAAETRVKGELNQSHCQQRSVGQHDGRDDGTLSAHWKYDPSELLRGSMMVSTPLPMGPTGDFPHQALNSRSPRARRPSGRVAGRGGARRRPPSRADNKAQLAKPSLVKQEDVLEPQEAGPHGQHRDNLPEPLHKAALYPLPTNSDTLSSLLTKQGNAPASGFESEATMRPSIHSQRQTHDLEGASDWTNMCGGKGIPVELDRSRFQTEPRVCNTTFQELDRSRFQTEPRVCNTTFQELDSHLSLQVFSDQRGESQSRKPDDWSKVTDKPSHLTRKQNDATGQDDPAIQSPILSRRRIRSFISPIPAKRLCQESKAREPEGKSTPPPHPRSPLCNPSLSPERNPGAADDPHQTNDEKGSPSGSVSPAASLTSPGKTKTLPPRQGRGLKLEAIVQKITSPNGRKFTAGGAVDGASDSVTLDDILSVKEVSWEGGEMVMVQPGYEVDHDPKEGPGAQAMDPGKGEACKTAHASSSQTGRGSSPTTGGTHHPKPKQPHSPCHLSCSPGPEAGEETINATPKAEGGTVKGYFPSGKKRGRPLGSINKQKRHRQESQGVQTREEEEEEEEEESAKGKRRPERKKPPSHPRRKRKRLEGPIAQPQEAEIKLKHPARAVGRRRGESQDKGFSPYVRLERKHEAAPLCTIINTEDDEHNRVQKGVKGHQGPGSSPQPSCVGKAVPTSSHMVLGPLVTGCSTLGLLVCCLCGKCANHRDLGDLFGPYYPHQYAGTLPKNPPPKKMMPAQSWVKVRHKSMPELLKTGQLDEEGKETGSVTGHARFKRRHYSEDCTPSWAGPRGNKAHRRCYCCEKTSSVDLRTQRFQSEISSQVELQLPQLPLDPNELWLHEACVLWASGVYLVSGRLYGLQEAVEMARETKCSHCQDPGATLGCYCKGCPLNYHYICAVDADCFLNEENFSLKCPKHKLRAAKGSSAEQSERG